jgi:putative oxidoreductase
MIAIYDALMPYAPYLALLLRVWMGANLVIHSRPKLGEGATGARAFAKTLGVPAAAARAVTYLELFGGIFLIVGLIVPIVALLFIVQFAAISIAKRSKLHAEYTSPGKPSYEIDILYLILSIAILVLGSGVLSFDGLIGI